MKTVYIDYQTLRDDFAVIFDEPGIKEEVYYIEGEKEWIVVFHKNGFYINCRVTEKDLLEEAQEQTYSPQILDDYKKKIREIPAEELQELLIAKIEAFKMKYLKKAIKVKKIEG